MTYQLPEPAIEHQRNGKVTVYYTKRQMQAAYQAGQADAREDLTIAYMTGYSKGRDSMKADAVKEPMDLTQENLERVVAEINAAGKQILMYPENGGEL